MERNQAILSHPVAPAELPRKLGALLALRLALASCYACYDYRAALVSIIDPTSLSLTTPGPRKQQAVLGDAGWETTFDFHIQVL